MDSSNLDLALQKICLQALKISYLKSSCEKEILSYEHKGNIIIEDLFNFYNYRDNIEFISPQLYRTLPNKIEPIYQELKKRAIVDDISGVMDTFAIREWETHHKK
ncbi:hypothetical protein ACLB1T_16120 [Escherichia coli]